MKAIFFIILLSFIFCDPNSFINASKEERIKREKIIKERLLKCIYENGSEEFKIFVKENEENLRKAFLDNRKNIKKEDKLVVRDCKKKIREERNEERENNHL